MLQSLSIKNVALITNLNIEFGEGFNVLLGETGAGKSIIFDALNFVLGAKADKTLIRFGENEMRVDAVFTNLSKQTKDNLSQFGYEDDEIGLSRTFNMEGRSTIRINGSPVTTSVLKEVGGFLVDSYSQHESVELLKTKNHLSMIDKFGGEDILTIKNQVKEGYLSLNEILKKIEKLGGDNFERERRLSLLEYQINEIEECDLKLGEDEELNEKINFYQSAEKINEAISICENMLNDGVGSCISQLQQSANALAGFGEFEEIEDCRKRLDSSRYEIEDVCETLLNIKSSTDFDEREFDKLDRRRDQIRSIIKKYGGSIEKSLEFLDKAKEEYSEIVDSESILLKLEKEKDDINLKLLSLCEKLSCLRKNVAKDIKDKVMLELAQLGMKSSRFDIEFQKLDKPTSNGFDDAEFVFSANKGQDVKSLSKTASGGELSRFMLAFKNIFASLGGAQTLVFDEIDSGISGETGKIVGVKLNNITQNSQVICITHLPQVASFGDDFYFVSKKEESNSTITEINHLKEDEIVYNLARMVVGDDVSDTALKQAGEMRLKAGKCIK